MSEVMHDDVQLQPATEGGSQQQDGHDEGISSKDQPSEMGSVVMNASADSLETDVMAATLRLYTFHLADLMT